jgi:hypothetical protein
MSQGTEIPQEELKKNPKYVAWLHALTVISHEQKIIIKSIHSTLIINYFLTGKTTKEALEEYKKHETPNSTASIKIRKNIDLSQETVKIISKEAFERGTKCKLLMEEFLTNWAKALEIKQT